jgi:class 3 adenylate cyclase
MDLLFCFGMGSHIDLAWDLTQARELYPRLASFSRLIMFDRRGMGASDAIPRESPPTWEDWTDDMLAVLDAVGSKTAALFASTDCGPIAILFAAMHPERVSALVLFNSMARWMVADDYPIGASSEEIESRRQFMELNWGTEEQIAFVNPSLADYPEERRILARLVRACATPHSAAAQFNYITRSVDVRQALPLIHVPTLVLHVRDNPSVPIAYGRYLGEHIPGATFLELPGADMGIVGREIVDAVVKEITVFLTGEQPQVEIDRILTTILFTDIVDSTERASQMGDRSWRALLDAHDEVVRDQLGRFRGREINTTGDGFVLSFDGPGRAVRCAQAILDATGAKGITLRAGLHSGECEVRGTDLGGLSVHIAARVGALAGAGEVLVSSTVRDLVAGSDIEFEDRGEHDLKGVPGSWKLFAVQV